MLTTEPAASTSSAPVSTASMISCLKGWSAKISRPSSNVCSWRTKGWSSLMMSRISASMRSRSSSLKWAPSGSSKS